MSGLVYCCYCDFSSSPRLMTQHEPTCAKNPNAVPPAAPPKPGHVASDHFLRLFDRVEKGEPRLRAMAAHCAVLYNELQDERALRFAAYRDIVRQLEAASPMTALALSLDQAARDMEDDYEL